MQHHIDQLEAQRREIIAALRERITGCGVARHTLAVAAGLSERALKSFDQEEWNPTAETIRKVDAYLDTLAENRNTIRLPEAERKGRRRASPEGPSDVAA